MKKLNLRSLVDKSLEVFVGFRLALWLRRRHGAAADRFSSGEVYRGERDLHAAGLPGNSGRGMGPCYPFCDAFDDVKVVAEPPVEQQQPTLNAEPLTVTHCKTVNQGFFETFFSSKVKGIQMVDHRI